MKDFIVSLKMNKCKVTKTRFFCFFSGLDIVRRDWCQLAANTGKEILSKILSDCSGDDRVSFIHETLEKIALDLNNGKIGLADLAITKSLTKDPNDYPDKKSLPHVQVSLYVHSVEIVEFYSHNFSKIS